MLDAAFDELRVVSQHRNVRVAAEAAELVETGSLMEVADAGRVLGRRRGEGLRLVD